MADDTNEDITLEPMEAESDGQASAFLLSDLVPELVRDAEETLKAATEGRPRGPITGLPTLDQALRGVLRPGLIGITGDPGVGKSTIALQMAATCGCPAIYVTAEQSRLMLLRKHISRVTNIPLDEVEAAVPKRIRELAEYSCKASPQLLLVDATGEPAHAEQIERLAAALRSRFKPYGLLVVVDALQPWSHGVRVGAEYEVLQAGLSDLVGIASELRAPVVVLSHRNRASAGSSGSTLTAAKGTAGFEHAAHTVLHLARAKDCMQDPRSPNVRVECNVAKNWYGPCGFSVPLTLNVRTQRFS